MTRIRDGFTYFWRAESASRANADRPGEAKPLKRKRLWRRSAANGPGLAAVGLSFALISRGQGLQCWQAGRFPGFFLGEFAIMAPCGLV